MLRVACPQVISLYGVVGATPGSDDPACLLMEFARYGSLSHLIKHSSAPFDWWKRMRILADIAKGMIRLHGSKPIVVHMDLKPQNVLICKGLVYRCCLLLLVF
jgi:serine/threonine protein kinase